MHKDKIMLMKEKLKVGDTVSLSLDGNHLVSGIVYICSSIPMGKFYSKQFGKNNIEAEDVYEDALVLIDNKRPGTLTVLTLEDEKGKMFVWNDVFLEKETVFKKIENLDSVSVDYSDSLLTEMTHSFK